MKEPAASRYHWRDLAEASIGACIMAFPVATTEEVWNLSAELSLVRALVFAFVSIAVLSLVVFIVHRHEGTSTGRGSFVLRVIATYGVSLFISALILLGLDRLDLFGEPLVAIKRTILVAFPASFAATAVDSFSGRS